MGVDMRLYIGTLIAVLVFFGLGVLVGIGITREPTAQRLEKQIRNLEERLTKELTRRDGRIRQLETELTFAHQRLKDTEQLLNAALPSLVSNRLIYRNVAIITCALGNDEAVIKRLQGTLQAAGATVPVRINLYPEVLQSADAIVWQQVAEQLKLVASGVNEEAVRKATWQRLAMLLRYGDPQGQWQALAKVGWAKLSGDFQTPVGSVVFIGAFRQGRDEDQVRTIDLPLLRALKSVGIRIVACETTMVTEGSVVPVYQLDDISTVDHLDTPMGLLSVIAVLTEQPDHYGLKPHARRPFPPFNAVPSPPSAKQPQPVQSQR